MISTMKVEELKSFLRLRGLKLTGKKNELVARVFVAVENDIPVVKTAEDIEKEMAASYQDKLILEDGVIMPDPFKLETGWLKEEEGMKFWPLTLYPDIFNFLAFHPSELSSKDLNDYKTSKAYSYHSQGWVSTLDFHNISGSSKYCVLKGTCRPSQRINDIPHKLWVYIQKQSGKVVSSHCTCMAGMAQTCNHVAAALFRLEASCRLGLTNPSCTSKACEWLPSNRKVAPMKIKDMKLSRNDFGKRGKGTGNLNPSPKKRYNPLSESGFKLCLDDIAAALRPICDETDCILFSAFEKSACPVVTSIQDSVKSHSEILLEVKDTSEYLQRIYSISKKDIAAVEKKTLGQSANPAWFSYRRHVITASKGHEVKTRLATLKRSYEKNISLESLFAKIAGTSHVPPELPALKYGRSMEGDAANCFEEIFKKTHKNVKVSDCGLILCEEVPFIGGSPDRIIECDCCGKACLEIKCPFSIRHLAPCNPEANLSYMNREGNVLTLKKTHKYYTQCQMQMVAAKVTKSYFFVWTAHGNILQQIDIDQDFWSVLKNDLTEFYVNLYLPSVYETNSL